MATRAVLLGWLGCPKRVLRRYEEAWKRAAGVTAVGFAPPPAVTLSPRECRRAAAHLDAPLGDGGAVVHCFSTGGLLALAAIAEERHRRGERVAPAGMVFECGPGRLGPTVSNCRGLAAGFTGTSADSLAASALAPALVAPILACLALAPAVRARVGEVNSLWGEPASAVWPFSNVDWGVPHLYLYSKGDVVVPPSQVEAFAKARELDGASASLQPFPRGRHCELLRESPERYGDALRSWHAQALASAPRR